MDNSTAPAQTQKVAAGSSAASSKPASTGRAVVTVFQLSMLTVVAVASLRSLPAMATYGLASILLYVVPAILFLIPTALVAAELATGWKGGVYTWVREAFGNRWGFVAIWLQWVQNVVWYPAQIAFIGASIAYMFKPDLYKNGIYTAAMIIGIYWVSTLIALLGPKVFAKVGSWGGVIGTVIPAALLIVIGIIWLATGNKSEVTLGAKELLPPWTGIASIVLIVSNFLAYAGMEMNAVHVNNLKNPGKGYPKVILFASVLILGIFIFPTLAISVITPSSDLGLFAGVNAAFDAFFTHFDMRWGTVVISALIAFGALASVVTWISGPSKGILAAGQTGLLPPKLQAVNKHGVQSHLLYVQGGIVTLLALLFVIIPDGNTAFFTLIDMAAALYLIMYMLMFAAVIKLRKSAPQVVRTYRVPAVKFVAGIGFVASLVAFVFSFVRPSGFTSLSTWMYPVVVALVVILLGVPPIVIFHFKKSTWDKRSPEEKARESGDVLVNPLATSQPTTAEAATSTQATTRKEPTA